MVKHPGSYYGTTDTVGRYHCLLVFDAADRSPIQHVIIGWMNGTSILIAAKSRRSRREERATPVMSDVQHPTGV